MSQPAVDSASYLPTVARKHLTMPIGKDLYDYEDRYQRVFEAGALYWNDPDTNPFLAQVVEGLPRGSNCVEFGCGEGYQARFIASRGHAVTAIDLSKTAIEKAIRETPPGLSVRFLVGDVTDHEIPGLPPATFELAVNIGCLHMMAESEDRSAHLDLVYRSLARGGRFFLQNGLALSDVQTTSHEEEQQLVEMKRHSIKQTHELREATIPTAQGPKTLMLPRCPACKMLSLDDYRRELEARGFIIISAERHRGQNFGYEAVILAEKP